MMRLVKDGSGIQVGYVNTITGNQQHAYKKNGEKVGWYDPASNLTHLPNGRIYAHGNLVDSLIMSC